MTISMGPRGLYAKTASRRREILEAGIEVFSTSGYRSGSIREIAQRVGMSQAGLLHHFSSKSDLLAAVLEFRDESDREITDFGRPGIDNIRGLVLLVEKNAALPGLVELHCVLSAEATSKTHPAHEYFRDRYARVVRLAAASFEQLSTQGHLIESADPTATARSLVALMDGLQVQWLLDRTSVDMAEQIRAYLRPLLTIDL